MAQEACGNRVCLIRRVPHRSEHCLPWPLERLPLKVHVPLLELFAAFKAACFAHWLESMGVASPGPALNARLTALTPALLAYLKGSSRLASFGRFTPLGALALSSTMPVAAYPPISTAGLNIYVLELVCSTSAAASLFCSMAQADCPSMPASPLRCWMASVRPLRLRVVSSHGKPANSAPSPSA